MKDIEELLQTNAPGPRRELTADFTASTLHKLAERPSTKFGRLKETLIMRFATFTRAHKPATIVAAVIGLIVISGTASAATIGWPNFSVLFGGQKTNSDGSRVVQIDTKNCTFINALNVTQKRTNDNIYYYRIKAGANLSNDQVTQLVRSQCEIEQESALNTQLLAQFSHNHNQTDVIGGYIDNVITAITPTSIAVDMTVPDGATATTHHLTYTHIDPDAIVMSAGKVIPLNDLKVGDHISVSYRATGDARDHSETTAPWDINPDQATLVTIIKIPAYIGESLMFQRHNNKDFEEVTPCTSQPDGYCTIEQLNKK